MQELLQTLQLPISKVILILTAAYRYLGADIEELMIMEAMRRSMQETTNNEDPQQEDLDRVLQESAQVNSSEDN